MKEKKQHEKYPTKNEKKKRHGIVAVEILIEIYLDLDIRLEQKLTTKIYMAVFLVHVYRLQGPTNYSSG